MGRRADRALDALSTFRFTTRAELDVRSQRCRSGATFRGVAADACTASPSSARWMAQLDAIEVFVLLRENKLVA
jgi:hypothetical protein